MGLKRSPNSLEKRIKKPKKKGDFENNKQQPTKDKSKQLSIEMVSEPSARREGKLTIRVRGISLDTWQKEWGREQRIQKNRGSGDRVRHLSLLHLEGHFERMNIKAPRGASPKMESRSKSPLGFSEKGRKELGSVSGGRVQGGRTAMRKQCRNSDQGGEKAAHQADKPPSRGERNEEKNVQECQSILAPNDDTKKKFLKLWGGDTTTRGGDER